MRIRRRTDDADLVHRDVVFVGLTLPFSRERRISNSFRNELNVWHNIGAARRLQRLLGGPKDHVEESISQSGHRNPPQEHHPAFCRGKKSEHHVMRCQEFGTSAEIHPPSRAARYANPNHQVKDIERRHT